MFAYFVNAQNKIEVKQKASMNCARSSFGCTTNAVRGEIYVAGGYSNAMITKNCEVYSIAEDRWKRLPQLNEEKLSATLCCLNNRYLYCFGGITKKETGNVVLNSIEMLDLSAAQPKWTMLAFKLPYQCCDAGAVAISPT